MNKIDATTFAVQATHLLRKAGYRIKVRYDGGGWYRWTRAFGPGYPYRRDQIEKMLASHLSAKENEQ